MLKRNSMGPKPLMTIDQSQTAIVDHKQQHIDTQQKKGMNILTTEKIVFNHSPEN